jgi:hypothetical protein
MKVEDHHEIKMEIAGWPVHVTSYRIGDTYHSSVDNVSPGATISRASASSREEAERVAVEKATERLGRTKRHAV